MTYAEYRQRDTEIAAICDAHKHATGKRLSYWDGWASWLLRGPRQRLDDKLPQNSATGASSATETRGTGILEAW